ncbi:MAG: hypothetical protein HUU08_08675 [Candidatus Brocadia sp.]|nr:hypothetical protein [Candidatus Brocadia sp.]
MKQFPHYGLNTITVRYISATHLILFFQGDWFIRKLNLMIVIIGLH